MLDISLDGISPVFEKVEKLDHVQKGLICAVSLGLTIAGFWYLLIFPKMNIFNLQG